MKFKTLSGHAWQLIWRSKFLIALGIVMAGAGISPDGSLARLAFSAAEALQWLFGGHSPVQPTTETAPSLILIPAQQVAAASGDRFETVLAVTIGAVSVLLGAGLLMAIAVAVVARLAAGGLIAAVGQPEEPGMVHPRVALHSAWLRALRLIVIVSIPPIPITVGGIVTLVAVGVNLYAAGAVGDLATIRSALRASPSLLTVLGVLNTILLVATLGLAVVQIFADRACLLEDRRPLDSFRRGWQVMHAHSGPVAGLLAVQVASGAVLSLLLSPPGVLLPVTCVLRPVRWAVTGLALAFFSTLWTLLWRAWTQEDKEARLTSAL